MEGDNIFPYRNMDIKLGGREMATVVYSNKEDDMCSLVIDGEEKNMLKMKKGQLSPKLY